MNLPLDPAMLLSVVNTYLRDKYPSLEDFCAAENADADDIIRRLSLIDYAYDAEKNQFI